MIPIRTLIIASALMLTGCEQVMQRLGLEDPTRKAEQNEAEGKAVGSACRHSGRAIEDCYSIYAWLPKSAIYTGWRDMDAYMRENQISSVEPTLPPPEPPSNKKKKKVVPADPEADEAKAAEDADGKGKDKAKH